ncbi:MAG: hypothetical protein EP330_03830 [Deltaproteobacteria bacterium]|nr:MAG: hypothetical protein EP330_03830 [Deltaproteobacteria bacterium]
MSPTRALALTAVATLVGLGTSCGLIEPKDAPSWTEQLEADSPCYRVDLLDGLDEESTAEFRDLFDCLNHNGHFESLAPTVSALETATTRRGKIAALEAAHAVNVLPDAGVDVFALAGVGVDLLRAEDRPIDEIMNVVLELEYGVRADIVRGGLELDSPTALGNGALVPLAPVLPAAAGAMLDDDLETAQWAGSLLRDPETKRWIRTFGSMATSEQPAIEPVLDRLVYDLGRAVQDTRTPGNDHWVGASGDSLRDAVDVMVLGPTPLMPAIAPETDAILSDARTRILLEDKLVQRYNEGVLQDLPRELVWLATVDIDGNPISRGEMSALAHFVRLLHDTNRPMVCTIDLWLTEINMNLGNLAQTILRTLAGMDPNFVSGGAGLLGGILDTGLSQTMMDELAGSGICPAITQDVITDLQAIDVIAGPETENLLIVFIDILAAMRDGNQDRIGAFADLASDLHGTGAINPVEEVVVDLAKARIISDIIDLLPVLSDPAAYGLTAGDEPAATLQDGLDLMTWLVHDDGSGTGYDQIAPLLRPVLDEDGTFTALHAAAGVMADSGSQTSAALDIVPPLLAADPDLELLEAIAPLLENPEVARSLLEIVEAPGVTDELLATTPTVGQKEVPLAFLGRLVVNGTLDDLLHMLDIMLLSFDEL